ncbi:MAG: phosphate ABC transporter substrate-binding protein [Verrucomicrobiota bacterium]
MKSIQPQLLALALTFASGVSAMAQGKLVIKGSDTLGAKMVPQLAEAYRADGNNATFEIAAEGSSTAFSNLLAGTADIGMSSRAVKDSEVAKFTAKGQKINEIVAAWDMIAVIVNSKNSLKGLTTDQIEGIFTGDITDWSEVGGKPGPISAYTRNTSSGTYKTFQSLGMAKRDYGSRTQKMAGNEQIATEVGKNINGIGYVGLAYTKAAGIKAVEVNKVACTPKKVKKYPLARKLFYYTVGEPTGEAKKFLDWSTKKKAAKKVVERVGFVPLKTGLFSR